MCWENGCLSHDKDGYYTCTCVGRMDVCHMTKMDIMPVHVLREWMFVT